MVVRKPKTAFQNKKTMKETSVLTNNALLNAQKQDTCAKEMSMNTDAKKKMYAFWDKQATRESSAQEPAQLSVKMDKFSVTELSIILTLSTKVAKDKTYAT